MTSEEQSGENQSTPRSYDCTFCKRGFTNAQALGGHMNIHRKEKAAKLKQSTSVSPSSLSSSNNMIPTTATLPWVVASTPVEGHGRSEDEEINTTLTSEETLIIGEVRRQLPLFDEKRSSNMNQKLEIHQVLASDQKIGSSSSRHDSTVPELDLELRLGPDPTNYSTPSSTAGSTTHFF